MNKSSRQIIKGFVPYTQGSESLMYKGTYLGKLCLLKERFDKKYRNPELDKTITKDRIKSECRSIARCLSNGIHVPVIYAVDFTRRMIFMQCFEHCITAKDHLGQCSQEAKEDFASRFGKIFGKMHSHNIIHGDLTTSNILLVNHDSADFTNFKKLEIVIIDFGLSHIESNFEDKGVDLYVLERALSSTIENSDSIFQKILNSYESEYGYFHQVYAKYKDIIMRGRKKQGSS